MEAIEIIKEHLKANGFDGLCGDDCTCDLEDLVPCMEDFGHCEPGYKIPCTGDQPECPADGNCDWHMTTEKPAERYGGKNQ